MKKIVKLLFIGVIVLFGNYAYGEYIHDLRIGVDKIIKPLSGKVVGLKSGYITIDKGSANGIKTGMVVSIVRNYGTYKEDGKIVALKKLVCYAVIKKVSSDTAWAKPIYGVDEKKHHLLYLIPDGWKYKNLRAKKNDTVLLNSGRQKVAILSRNPVLYDTLKKGFPKIDFVDRDWVDANRVDLKIYGEDWKRLNTLAFKLGIDYFFIPQLDKKDDNASFNLTVVAGLSGKKLGKVSVPLSSSEYSSMKGRLKKSELLINPDNITASNLDLQYKQTIIDKILGKVGVRLHHGSYQMAIAGLRTVASFRKTDVATDLAISRSGDDYLVIVAAGGSATIYGYRNGDIQRLQELSPINVVFVDLHKRFLIVSGFNRYGMVKSIIYRYKNKADRFVKIAETNSWMRFVHWNGKVMIAAQAGGVNRLFASKIYLYTIKKNELVKSYDISFIAKKASFYNWDSLKIKDKKFLVYLSRSGNIVVEDNGKIIHQTNSVFGFGKNRITRYPDSQTTENPEGGTILTNRPIKFFLEKNGLQIVAIRNYRTAVISSLLSNPSNGSAIMQYLVDKDGLHRMYASGNIFGRLSAISGMDDLLVVGRAVPSDFLRRLWNGEKEKGVITLNRKVQ